MKKVIAIILTMIMVVCNCIVVFGDTAITAPTTFPQNVTATYTGSASDLYKVDITWGSLEYTYSPGTGEGAGQWNTTDHKYNLGDGTGWAPKDNDVANSEITVVNHSNVDIVVEYNFEPNTDTGSVFSDIKGDFENIASSTSTSGFICPLPSAVEWSNGNGTYQTKTLHLSLFGVPSDRFSNSEKKTVGTVTIEIFKNELS